MFIRKLFKVGDKAKWLALELLIVFIGVYMAFLFQQYGENKKLQKEKDKVLTSLKLELEEFRTGFPRFSVFQKEKTDEWDSLFAIEEVGDYYNWRYYEPQYNIRIIEYALNQEGTDVINFEIYDELSKLHARIKQLEFAERKMTAFGENYRLIPASLPKNSTERTIMNAENRFTFYKFIEAAKSRTRSLRDVARESAGLLIMVNQELGPEKTRQADMLLLRKYVEADVEIDFVKEVFLEFFPQYTTEEFDEEVRKIQQAL
ncbi:hypothetical protein [Roseivirga pacifica]|uniref:hypothetical protein n=1 Tax=Roseivirga pacifica TaxID=1267423 RepID=UPI00227C69F6|nr:hypothetical protein [Roseivirga pacifica]